MRVAEILLLDDVAIERFEGRCMKTWPFFLNLFWYS
jgi:hypothetical protein